MQSVDMNGGHMNGIIDNASKANLKVMFLMHYRSAIVKLEINRLIFWMQELYGTKILSQLENAMSSFLVTLIYFIVDVDMNKPLNTTIN